MGIYKLVIMKSKTVASSSTVLYDVLKDAFATFSEIEKRNVLDIHFITGYRWIYCTLTTTEYLVHSHHMTVQERCKKFFK